MKTIGELLQVPKRSAREARERLLEELRPGEVGYLYRDENQSWDGCSADSVLGQTIRAAIQTKHLSVVFRGSTFSEFHKVKSLSVDWFGEGKAGPRKKRL